MGLSLFFLSPSFLTGSNLKLFYKESTNIYSNPKRLAKIIIGTFGVLVASVSGIILATSGSYLAVAIAPHLINNENNLIDLTIFLFLSSIILYLYNLYLSIYDGLSVKSFSLSVSAILIGQLILNIIPKEYEILQFVGFIWD